MRVTVAASPIQTDQAIGLLLLFCCGHIKPLSLQKRNEVNFGSRTKRGFCPVPHPYGSKAVIVILFLGFLGFLGFFLFFLFLGRGTLSRFMRRKVF